MKILLITMFFSVLSLFNGQCTADSSALGNKPSKIVYEFKDSSVPPEYHRSYVITITKSEARLAVDSYGKVVEEATLKITDKEFNQIVETIAAAKIRRVSETSAKQGCAGGTSETLKLFDGNKESLTASIYNCGGESYGNLKGDIAAVKAKVTALFPKTENRLK
jgi:hypothetical protein